VSLLNPEEERRKGGKEGSKTHELRSRKSIPSSVLLELIKSARRRQEISRVKEGGGGRHGWIDGRGERREKTFRKGWDGSSPPNDVFRSTLAEESKSRPGL